jgi:hypothetical protein
MKDHREVLKQNYVGLPQLAGGGGSFVSGG